MKTKIKQYYKALLLTVISFTLAFLTARGTIQNYINFTDALNEIAFFMLAIMAGTVGLFSYFKKS